ncbi:CPBP family intramembrane glutamic endopeptidase [Haliangium sp.]|uniref:CPBP family intramembrane glutamic endopeptidase n=1 Tax=Haliangium sp. TaxID=2663208 RepID=UPI003D10AEEC
MNRRRPVTPSVLGHGDLATSLILIFPLFLAYEIGVMFSSSVNGVDFVTRHVFAAVEYERDRYLLVQLGFAVAFLGYVLYMRRRRELSRDVVLPLVLEAAVYALTLGSFIVFLMQNVLGFALAPGSAMSIGAIGDAVVVSLGAGVHEELVFRLGLMAGGAALLRWGGVTHSLAVASALFASALVFSLAHHIGPYGEPFQLGVFVYRSMAGAIFGLIFYYRSLAHAVYTHFLYDLYVLVLRA